MIAIIQKQNTLLGFFFCLQEKSNVTSFKPNSSLSSAEVAVSSINFFLIPRSNTFFQKGTFCQSLSNEKNGIFIFLHIGVYSDQVYSPSTRRQSYKINIVLKKTKLLVNFMAVQCHFSFTNNFFPAFTMEIKDKLKCNSPKALCQKSVNK